MELKWTVREIVVTSQETDIMNTSEQAEDKCRTDPGPCRWKCFIITVLSASEINIKAHFKNQH